MPRKVTREKGGREAVVGLVLQLVAVVVSLGVLFVSISGLIAYSSAALQIFAIVIFSALYVATMYAFFRYVTRLRRYELRIATTGQPDAGKTVFSLILFSELMADRTDRLVFTSNSKGVIQIVQALRAIPHDIWPEATGDEGVVVLEGKLKYGKRETVEVEVGDSAGEHWANLSNRDERSGDYLRWLLGVHALCHVIEAPHLVSEDAGRWIQADVDDLTMYTQLLDSTREQVVKQPLLVVISKMDLVGVVEGLSEVRALGDVQNCTAYSRLEALHGTSPLDPFFVEARRYFDPIDVVFTSVYVATGDERIPTARDHSLAMWIRTSARR
jgi:hypothetical protein